MVRCGLRFYRSFAVNQLFHSAPRAFIIDYQAGFLNSDLVRPRRAEHQLVHIERAAPNRAAVLVGGTIDAGPVFLGKTD